MTAKDHHRTRPSGRPRSSGFADALRLATARPLMTGLAGCLESMPLVGGGSKGAVSGATAENASNDLEHCKASLGTIAVIERGGAMRAGSVEQNDAATTLIMIDNRSGVQLAAAEGSARFRYRGLGRRPPAQPARTSGRPVRYRLAGSNESSSQRRPSTAAHVYQE